MEKKTKGRGLVLSILTLGCLLLIYPFLNIGDAKRINAQTINIADIAAHNTSSDCWLVISGKVYNVTNFLSQHSGGSVAIMPFCGKDATVGFPHSSGELSVLSAYYIGDIGIIPSPPPIPAPILTKIIISPKSISLKIGDTELFKTYAYDQDNKLMAGVAITYSSSDTNIGTIDPNGLFVAKSVGSILITASSGDLKSVANIAVAESQPVPDPTVPPVPSPKPEHSRKPHEKIHKKNNNNHNNKDTEEKNGSENVKNGSDADEEEIQSESSGLINHAKINRMYDNNERQEND